MSRCRSCGAEIIWIKMTSGKMMPCDAAPISYGDNLLPTEQGDMVYTLVTDRGTIVKARFDPRGDKIGYVSHYATCPNANQHRRR